LPLGIITRSQPLELNGVSVSLGDLKRYTGLKIYNRPHAPLLVAGCLAMMFGLIWHFYFRHRDRAHKKEP
jgi:cytochrome c biogenesis protein ResB